VNPLTQATEAVSETYLSLLAWAWTWWWDTGGLRLSSVRTFVTAMSPVSAWFTTAVLAGGLVLAAAVTMVRRRGADVANLLVGLGRAALAWSATWLLLASAWSLGDASARWIIGGRARVLELRAVVADATTATDPAVCLALCVVGIACCLTFVAVVIGRFGIAVLLALALPVLAAASVLPGARSLRPALSWAVAVAAFPPVCAAIYRVAHGLATGTDEPVVVLLVAGLSFLAAAAALPGMTRVVAR
jgi:hypothetical protein